MTTFEDLRDLSAHVRDKIGREKAVEIIQKYGETLSKVSPSSYDALEADLRRAMDAPEREAMMKVLIAFKMFWQTTPGQQAETIAVEMLVNRVFDFKKAVGG